MTRMVALRRYYRIGKARAFLLLLACCVFGVGATAQARPDRTPLKVIIDTDTGVDDAAAIVALLQQDRREVDILGITTVAGNTTVDHATNNVLAILEAAGRTDIPVIIGAAQPLAQPLSRTGAFIHGPDGLWFVGMQQPHDLSSLSRDVPAFYRDMAVRHPDATVVTLGPLTNLAQVHQNNADTLRQFKQIVALGGAKVGGNRTPVGEANIVNDPEAAEIVLQARLPLTLLTLDAFTSLRLSSQDVERIAQQGTPAARLIAGPLAQYLVATAGPGADTSKVTGTIPDAAAVLYALDPTLGTTQPALIKVSLADSLTRGQTVIGLTLNERIPMIADDAELSSIAERVFSDPQFNFQAAIGAILAREPDNAQVILDIQEQTMQRLLLRSLTR
jgi:inosine-uridine nucleoside N-ribohydrolase